MSSFEYKGQQAFKQSLQFKGHPNTSMQKYKLFLTFIKLVLILLFPNLFSLN